MKTMRSVAQLIVRPRRRSHMGAETICLFCAERARATYLENLKASLLGNRLTPLSRAQHFLCSFGSVKYFNLIYSSRLLWRFFSFGGISRMQICAEICLVNGFIGRFSFSVKERKLLL